MAISNLQALASFGTQPLRAPVIDARRGEVFVAIYDSDLRLVSEEVVVRFDDWMKASPRGDIEIIQGTRELAGALAIIAAARFQAGLGQDPADIDANYVRRSDAELFWRDKI